MKLYLCNYPPYRILVWPHGSIREGDMNITFYKCYYLILNMYGEPYHNTIGWQYRSSLSVRKSNAQDINETNLS